MLTLTVSDFVGFYKPGDKQDIFSTGATAYKEVRFHEVAEDTIEPPPLTEIEWFNLLTEVDYGGGGF